MVQLLIKVMFWLGVSTVIYAYVLYPVLIWGLAGLRRERRSGCEHTTIRYSVVLAVRDEAARINARLDELLGLIATAGRCAEVIVVADGCTDATAALARSHQCPLVRVIELLKTKARRGRCRVDAKWRKVTSLCSQTRDNVGPPPPCGNCCRILIVPKWVQ